MALVYDAGSRRTLIRVMIWLITALGVLFCWLGYLGWTFPQSDQDRLLAALIGFGGGIATAASMLVYGRCYISQVEVEDDGTARVRTIGLFGAPEHVLRPGDVGAGAYHDGHFGGYRGYAPWYTVRVRGRRIPLILDPVGDVFDADAAEQALGLEAGSLFVWEKEDRPPLPRAPKPGLVLTRKERKRFKRERRRRR